MKRLKLLAVSLSLCCVMIINADIFCYAQQQVQEEKKSRAVVTDQQQEEKTVLDDIVVTGRKEGKAFVVTPSMTTISIEDYESPNTAQNVLDIIKDQAVIDFRGQSDLVPGYDTMYMKGFDSHRFTLAQDGMSIDYGGEAGFNVVNFGSLSLGQIESIEIIPGPHSALYGGKSEGGIINIKSKVPERYTTTTPDLSMSASYKSYNTQNYSVDINGGVNSFFYGFSYQYYSTDGYLINNDAEIKNYSAKIGYILPSDGYVSLGIDYTDSETGLVVKNEKGTTGYDDDYPETTTARYSSWQRPVMEEEDSTYRFNYEQPHLYGTFTLAAYYQDQDRFRYSWEDESHSSKEEWSLTGSQAGGRIQDELQLSDKHTLTLGYDLTHMWRPEDLDSDNCFKAAHNIATQQGYYVQDKWTVFPRLSLTAGLRYEEATFWRDNVNETDGTHYISGRGDWIERNQSQLVPKSFLTYELDDLSKVLRDTSVSVGISKIWNPMAFCYGCGRDTPTTAWAEPEHGIGYDFVFIRRLWKDISFKANYSYYIIKDYVASNSSYAIYTPSSTNTVAAGEEYKDLYINLDEMLYQGVELEFNGHIIDDLSFYLSYAYTDLDSQGGEPAGEEAEDERAEHRFNAGLRYTLFENTLFMLDYKYQSEQTTQSSEEIGPDEYVWYTVDMDAYSLVDFAVQQTLFKEYRKVKDLVVKLYINNLLDEEYVNSKGYPMTDQTVGVSLSCRF